ncbi:tetratricopeptide repeat protein [Methylotuvimicrobium sp. KM1]|uniref:tetratricopeptide repeat protein n=1 Tax=Methylotuvimicrobium sp. KM1 TaxID=3377707 RepID=UPI00384FDEF7
MRLINFRYCKIKILLGAAMMASGFVVNAAKYDVHDLEKDNFFSLDEPMFDGRTQDFLSEPEGFEKQNELHIRQEMLSILQKANNNQLAEAKKQVQDLINKNPNVVDLFMLKAAIELKEKNFPSAKASLRQALNIDKSKQAAILGLASIEYQEGNVSKAKQFIEQALAANDKLADPYLLLLQIEADNNNPDNIKEVIDKALNKIKGSVDEEAKMILNASKFYVRIGQSQKALSHAQNLVDRHQDSTVALSLLASIQIMSNQGDEAIKTLRKIINIDRQDVRSRMLLANILVRRGEEGAEVIDLMRQASEISPKNLQLKIQSVDLMIQLQRFDEALAIAKRVAEVVPKSGLGKSMEGDVYLAQRDLEKAYAAYSEAYNMQPNEKLLGTIVDLLGTQGKQDEALSLLKSELQKNDKNMMAHIRMAGFARQREDYAEEEKHYKAALSVQPENPFILNNLAWLYYEKANPKALELSRKAFQLAPKNGDIADTLGVILLQQGKIDEAAVVLEKAVELKSDDLNIKYHLAKAYVAEGNRKEAEKILIELLQTDAIFESKEKAGLLLEEIKKH